MSQLQRFLVAFVALGATFAATQTAAALPGPVGALFSDSAAAGCVASLPSPGCTTLASVAGASDVAISGDGRSAYVAASSVSSVSVLGVDARGTFTPAATPCIGSALAAGCTRAIALSGVAALALSPDDKHLYAAAPGASAVAVLARDAASGALSQAPASCIADEVPSPIGPLPREAGCIAVQGLAGASAVAVSPDGAHVYVASATADAVALLERSPVTGSLAQPAGATACISTDIAVGPAIVLRDLGCGSAAPLAGATAIEVSPDGAHVYVAAPGSKAVVVLARNATTGALSFTSCVSDDVDDSAAELAFTPACAVGQGLSDPTSVAVSPGGESVYVVNALGSSVAAFQRDAATGALTQLTSACLVDAGSIASDPQCTPASGLTGASDVAVSGDATHVYVAAGGAGTVATFARDIQTGTLTQLRAPHACLSAIAAPSSCTGSPGLAGAAAVAPTPDGRHVVAAAATQGVVMSLERQLAPICTATSLAGVSGPTSVPLACDDPNGDPLTFSVVRAPSNGSVTNIDHEAGSVTYAPVPGAARTDTFSYTAADDGGATGTPALASLELTAGSVAALVATPPDTRAPQLRAGKLVVDRNRRVRVKLRCPSHETLGCVGTIKIKTVRRVPASKLRLAKVAAGPGVKAARVLLVPRLRFSLRGATTRTISTRLPKKYVRLLKRLGPTRVDVIVVARDQAGNVARSSRRVVLQPTARR